MNNQELNKVSGVYQDCQIEDIIRKEYQISIKNVQSLPGYVNFNFKLTLENDSKRIVKVYRNMDHLFELEKQTQVLLFLNSKSQGKYSQPIAFPDGKYIKTFEWKGKSIIIRMLTFLQGILFDECEVTPQLVESLGKFMGNFTKQINGWKHPETQLIHTPWNFENYHKLKDKQCYIKNEETKEIISYFLDEYEKHVVPLYPKLRKSTLHNDFSHINIITDGKVVTKLIDFGAMMESHLLYEISGAMYFLCYTKQDPLYWSTLLLQSYHQEIPLTQEQVYSIPYSMALRVCTSITVGAYNKSIDPGNEYLSYHEKEKQVFIRRWKELGLQEAREAYLKATGFE